MPDPVALGQSVCGLGNNICKDSQRWQFSTQKRNIIRWSRPLPASGNGADTGAGIYKLLIFIHGLPIPTYSLFPVKQKIINFTEIAAGNLTGAGGFREAAYEDKTVIKRQI